ncbi:MAG: hypothetical protein U1E62_05505 [Alsobacter sp.]
MISPAELRRIVPTARSSIVVQLCDAFEKHWLKYEITTPERQAHFIAQAAHETAGFTTLEELGRPAYFKRYDPCTVTGKRLGNTQPGDGLRYKGRGIFQLTGRANYAAYGARLKLPLVDDPDLAAIPENSVRVACEYWKARGLNAWADRDDVREITRRINGGQNGLSDRMRYLAQAKAVLAGDEAPVGLLSTEEVPDAPIALEPVKTWWQSKIAWSGAGIGGLSFAQAWSSMKDIAHQVVDDPAETVMSAIDQHPRVVVLVVILALASYIVFERVRMLREGR